MQHVRTIPTLAALGVLKPSPTPPAQDQKEIDRPMKLIIAQLPGTPAFEPLRRELNELGVLRVASSQVHGSHPQSAIQLRYRGASLDAHLRAQLRIECVVADGQAPAVIGVLRRHAGPGGQVAVIGLEDVYPECSREPLDLTDAWADAAVR